MPTLGKFAQRLAHVSAKRIISVNKTEHNLNDRSYSENNRNRPIGLVGDTPTLIKIVNKHDGLTLGSVATTSGFICLLEANRLTPSDVALDCCLEQARVWRYEAWRSDELAAYSSDGGVA